MSIIFYFIRNLVSFFKKNHFKILKVEKNNRSKEYIITFFTVGKRQVFVKSTFDIVKKDDLINKFDPIDAATIGFYTAQSSYEKCNG